MKNIMWKNFAILACIVALSYNFTKAEDKSPLKIVSLVPSSTEIINSLGQAHTIVGHTNFCPLKSPNNSQEVASAITVNIEKVLSLKPDYIITSGLVDEKSRQKFLKLGLKVKHYPYPQSLKAIKYQFMDIAKILGQEKKAKDILDSIDHSLNTIKKITQKNSSKQKIFFQIGSNPIWTTPSNTFMDEYTDWINGINVAHSLKQGSVNREQVLAWNPDAIFITTMGAIDQAQKSEWLKYTQLSAVKKQQIFILDSNIACRPTPTSFLKSVQEIARLLYPQDF